MVQEKGIDIPGPRLTNRFPNLVQQWTSSASPSSQRQGSGIAARQLASAKAKAAAEAKAAGVAAPQTPTPAAAGEAAAAASEVLSPEELAAHEELAVEHDAEQAAQAQEPAADAGAAGAAGAGPAVATTGTVYLQADVDRPALPKGEAPPATGVDDDIAPGAGAAPGAAAGAAEGTPGSASRSEGAAQAPGSAAGGIPDWWPLREEIAAAAAAHATAAARSGDPEAARRAIDLIFARLSGRVDLEEEAAPQDLTPEEEIAQPHRDPPADGHPPRGPGEELRGFGWRRGAHG